MTNPNKRVIVKGVENKLSKRASGGAGKRMSADAPDATVVVIVPMKKAKTDDANGGKGKRGDAERKREAEELISRIDAVEGVNTTVTHDTCPEVAAGIKKFLQRDGVTKAMLLGALGNINHNSMGQFVSGKEQDQCGNVTYRSGYAFLEKLRILEGRLKSKARARLRNETENPDGVRASSYIVCAIRRLIFPFLILYGPT
jgi:hypothetical protein